MVTKMHLFDHKCIKDNNIMNLKLLFSVLIHFLLFSVLKMIGLLNILGLMF